MNSRPPVPPSLHRQRGAVLMVMLVILIIGFTTFIVGALSQNTLKIDRDNRTSDALAQAKDALIGRAATDPTVPGSLPCPDTNDDGSAELFVGNDCPSYVGRLPWKTLGLPDLRDGTGARLWYALSRNFRDNPAAHISSDTVGTITVFGPDGSLLNDGTCSTYNGSCKPGAVALVIAPGIALARLGGAQQDRGIAGANNPVNYLDIAPAGGTPQDNAVFNGTSTATAGFIEGVVKVDNSGNVTNDRNGTIIVNDQMLVITTDQLLPVVEMRIAREVRTCLDAYALASSNMYPWAAPVTPLSYTGAQGTLFGRISSNPDTNVTTTTTTYNTTYVPLSGNDPNYSAVNSALINLQLAVTACTMSDGGVNPNNLNNAADNLIGLIAGLPNPPYSASFITRATNAANAGTANNACNLIENNPTNNSVQTNLTAAQTTLSNLTVAVTTPTTTTTTAPVGGPAWPAGCFATGTYWDDWKSLVFYQIDDKYKPGGIPGTPNITINGSGNYRAAVLLSRRPIGNQVRSPTDATTYLEGINPHAPVNPALNFETYRLVDNPPVNDLVLCLDERTSGACQ